LMNKSNLVGAVGATQGKEDKFEPGTLPQDGRKASPRYLTPHHHAKPQESEMTG
jgi:hypothetical protein